MIHRVMASAGREVYHVGRASTTTHRRLIFHTNSSAASCNVRPSAEKKQPRLRHPDAGVHLPAG